MFKLFKDEVDCHTRRLFDTIDEYETFHWNGRTISALPGLLIKHEVEHISTLDSLRGTSKLSLLRCIVKACEHNGLGDMKITIRDPTGTVKASVHHKAIDHPEIGVHLKVGSVIILQDVFGSDIGGPTDDLVRLSIPIDTNKPPTRSIADILSKLIPPLHKPEGTG
ncbi:uncharacterized protein HKW66_Vig0151410 [Vigna angularis]|uniref:Homologous recombination OB-fold protein OB-fold domain-containing protein n=1 Tax=Phaseolus angularis TaxID=3914 RepID=A0A8T0JU08_PHAAN|nr:uncharacterized protein HKW66_Vig0151410 [Vigna angularis]